MLVLCHIVCYIYKNNTARSKYVYPQESYNKVQSFIFFFIFLSFHLLTWLHYCCDQSHGEFMFWKQE